MSDPRNTDSLIVTDNDYEAVWRQYHDVGVDALQYLMMASFHSLPWPNDGEWPFLQLIERSAGVALDRVIAAVFQYMGKNVREAALAAPGYTAALRAAVEVTSPEAIEQYKANRGAPFQQAFWLPAFLHAFQLALLVEAGLGKVFVAGCEALAAINNKDMFREEVEREWKRARPFWDPKLGFLTPIVLSGPVLAR